jgi:hypothetical protein
MMLSRGLKIRLSCRRKQRMPNKSCPRSNFGLRSLPLRSLSWKEGTHGGCYDSTCFARFAGGSEGFAVNLLIANSSLFHRSAIVTLAGSRCGRSSAAPRRKRS